MTEPKISTPVHYAYIDALRGLAIFGVIAFHCSGEFKTLFGAEALATGESGVQLFYVVSAFSLMLSMAHRAKKGEPELLHHYAIRRFMRIAPMFYLAIAVWLIYRAVDPFGMKLTQPSAPQIATAMTFVNGWIPGHINAVLPGAWSIAIETSFYLLLPLFFRFIKSLPVALIVSVIFAAAGAYVSKKLPQWLPGVPAGEMVGFKYYWLPAQLGVFLLGIVLFFVVQRVRNVEMRPFFAPLILIAAIVSFAFIGWLPGLPVRHYFISIPFVFLALSLSMKPNRLFVNPFWSLLGKVSFSAYLLHTIVIHAGMWSLQHFMDPSAYPFATFAILFPAVVLATMALAWITYRVVELPGQAVGKRLIARLTPPRASAIVPAEAAETAPQNATL